MLMDNERILGACLQEDGSQQPGKDRVVKPFIALCADGRIRESLVTVESDETKKSLGG